MNGLCLGIWWENYRKKEEKIWDSSSEVLFVTITIAAY
jgi:hypothetical protein